MLDYFLNKKIKIFKKNNDKVTNLCTSKIIIILFGCLYLTIVFCNHYFFRTWAFDYGSYNFAFYDYSHFRISDSPIFPAHISFMQDHVSFTLMLLLPIYWLFGWLTQTYTLSIIQTFIILYGGWAIYKLIEFKTSDKLLSILALLQYFILYGRWASFCSACNIAIIASSMIPVFLYFYEKKKIAKALFAFIFILLSREDMALWTLFIGIFLAVSHFSDKKLFLAAAMVVMASLVYFLFVFNFIIPWLATSYKKFDLFNYSALGRGPYNAFFFIIAHPIKVFELLFTNTTGNQVYNHIKFEFYYVYFLFGGFLLFYKPKYLLLFLPLIAKKMLNDDPIRWSIESYYSIEFVSILPIAVFLIISEERNRIAKNIFITVVCLNSLGITTYKLLQKGRVLNYDNTNFAFFKGTMYKSDIKTKLIYHELNLIPPNAKVSACGTINPHLAYRPIDYYFPRVDDAEYIAVFRDRDTWPLKKGQFDFAVNYYLNNKNWTIEVDDYPFLLLKRQKNKNYIDSINPVVSVEYVCDAETRSTDGQYFTNSSGFVYTSGNLQSNEYCHSGNYSLKLTQYDRQGMKIILNDVKAGDRFVITAWRFAKESNAYILAIPVSGGNYYNVDSTVVKRDDNGWELLKKSFEIPYFMPTKELEIGVQNSGTGIVFFDDLKIQRQPAPTN